MIEKLGKEIKILNALGVKVETAKWDFLSRLISIKKAVESKRHLTRGTTHQKRNSKFHIFLDSTETHPDSLNDLQKNIC